MAAPISTSFKQQGGGKLQSMRRVWYLPSHHCVMPRKLHPELNEARADGNDVAYIDTKAFAEENTPQASRYKYTHTSLTA